MLWKKTSQLVLCGLLQQVQRQAAEQLQQAAQLPGDVYFRFDSAISVLTAPPKRRAATHRTQRRRRWATRRRRYAATWWACNTAGLRRARAVRRPAVEIPLSSLWDQQQKFLFYLGHLHDQAAPALRQCLAQRGSMCWLLDGAVEPGTPVFLGVREAASGLQEEATRYGWPGRVLHDLSPTMNGACDEALPGVPHFVCHDHLARGVGEEKTCMPNPKRRWSNGNAS